MTSTTCRRDVAIEGFVRKCAVRPSKVRTSERAINSSDVTRKQESKYLGNRSLTWAWLLLVKSALTVLLKVPPLAAIDAQCCAYLSPIRFG